MTASRGRWEGRGGGLDFPWHLGSAAPTAGRLQVACGGCGGVFAPCARLCQVSPGRTGLAPRGHLALPGCRGAAIWAGGAPRCDRLDPRQEECVSAGFFQEYSGKVQEKPLPGPAGAPRAAVSRGMLGSPRISTGVLVALSLGPCRGRFGVVGVAGCPAGLGGCWVSSPEPSPDAGGGRGALGQRRAPSRGGRAGMGVERGFGLPTPPGGLRVASALLAAPRTCPELRCRQGWRGIPLDGQGAGRVSLLLLSAAAAARCGDKLLEPSHPSG